MPSMGARELADLIRRHAGLVHKIAYAYCRDVTGREDRWGLAAGERFRKSKALRKRLRPYWARSAPFSRRW